MPGASAARESRAHTESADTDSAHTDSYGLDRYGPAGRTDPTDPGPLYIVASRLPVEYDAIDGWRRSPGGLVSALEPTLSHAAAWFGQTRPGEPPPVSRMGGCELIELPISSSDREAAHDGFCNRTLWPALHGLTGHVEERSSWWDAWRRRTAEVAEIVAREALPDATVWVHDYHFFGLAAPLRRYRPDLRVGLTCHTPVVDAGLQDLAHTRELARDLADFALITVQTERDRTELLRWLERWRPSTDRSRVIVNPVGFDVDGWIARRNDAVVLSLAERHRSASGVLVAGVDRVDYTKGLLHKLHAVEVLLARGEIGPDDLRFVQVAVPSRTSIPLYRYLGRQMDETTARINADFPRRDGRPVVTLIREQMSPRQVAGLMRAADIGLVTPACDGMNLVALEYAVLNGDRPCELILSRGAGAADHIGRWCRLVDGTDVNGIADAIAAGVSASDRTEAADRSRRRAAAATSLTVGRWSRTFLERLPRERLLMPVQATLPAPAAGS